MIQLTINQLNEILQNKGASLDFKTGLNTNKQGFFISQKETETTILNIDKMPRYALLERVNKILSRNVYNKESNIKNILGFWIDNNNTLYIDISKCLKVNKNNIYLVKDEAFKNNQYSVYNNIENATYNLITPIYTLYNTSDLLNTINSNNINNYSIDFYNIKDLNNYLNKQGFSITEMIFNSVDEIPEDYQYNKVIIKDLANFTRDILELDYTTDLKELLKNSRLIKEED